VATPPSFVQRLYRPAGAEYRGVRLYAPACLCSVLCQHFPYQGLETGCKQMLLLLGQVLELEFGAAILEALQLAQFDSLFPRELNARSVMRLGSAQRLASFRPPVHLLQLFDRQLAG